MHAFWYFKKKKDDNLTTSNLALMTYFIIYMNLRYGLYIAEIILHVGHGLRQ